MSIEVSDITKIYREQYALRDVSFRIDNRQIVGFLGPNGAGKSTMMKILTCYIPPTSGSAKVLGYDVQTQQMDVRRNIGYLPEHNPLYLEMYVKEFLAFSARLYKVGKVSKRVDEMIGITGLGREQHKKIGALSKGYRQRVGLAQAMIHDPKVLILDEPTTGLDPNQLEEIRNLIRSLGKEKTVMLSTHIMQEVEAICDQVIIINKGEIVAHDVTGNLRSAASVQIVIVEFDKPVSEQELREIPEVSHVRALPGGSWQLESAGDDDLRKSVFNFAVGRQLGVLTLNKVEQKIEDVFKSLTR